MWKTLYVHNIFSRFKVRKSFQWLCLDGKIYICGKISTQRYIVIQSVIKLNTFVTICTTIENKQHDQSIAFLLK